jgi:TolB protein
MGRIRVKDRGSGAAGRSGLLLVCIAALGVAVFAAPAHAAFPGQNGRIAFTTARDAGNSEIYTMNSDGSGLVNLTANAAYDASPAGSADGLKIVFSSHQDGNPEIYSMNTDGTGLTRLTNDPASEIYPTWSPDGTKVAFTSDRDGDMEIYTMNADGTGQVNLTHHPSDDSAPSWSPDGTKIAFESFRASNSDIYTMNPDGSGLKRLTRSPANAEPSWSPDGTKIIFRSGRDDPDPGNCGLSPPPYCITEIYTMNADGSAETRITNNTDFDFDPVPSPDGTKIVFTRITADNNAEIYVMNMDGTDQTNITNDPTLDTEPYWLVNNSYVRPQGAVQLRVPLTLAYKQCGDDETPNRNHGPELEEPSCNPASQASDNLTVGTNDANSLPAQSVGSIKLTVCPSGTTASDACSTPPSMTVPDMRIEAQITDVRCKAGVSTCEGGVNSDYTGELQTNTVLQITDKHNSVTPGGTGDSATVQDLAYPFTVPCVANPAGGSATAIGATCSVTSRANAVSPGSIVANKRANWELGKIDLNDGGPDGDVDTADNTLFETQGIFVP